MTAWKVRQKLGGHVRATLFEATDRLGGKIRTQTFDAVPARYEAGVAEIYDYATIGHDPLRELVTQVCQLEMTPMDSEAVVLDGEFLANLDAVKARHGAGTAEAILRFRQRMTQMMTPEQYYEGSSRDDNDHPWMDWNQAEVLDREVADPVARRYLRVMARSDIASEPHLTSGLNALKNMLMDVDGYIGVYAIVGGNERLVDELATRIDAVPRLRHRVLQVGRTPQGKYRLTTLNEGRIATQDFDFVVMSLPHNWLSTVAFEGERLRRAMERHVVRFDRPAHYLRLSILFRTPFWRDHVDGSWFMTDAFNGCCVYDEGSRHDVCGHGVLNWLISGSDCLAWVNAEPKDLLDAALASLPAVVREQARAEVVEFRTHPYLASVNAIPGGVPTRGPAENHVPDPQGHPGLILTGDYLFDSTLNGLLDSCDFATDVLLSRVMERRYAAGLSQARAALQPNAVALPAPCARIDRAYFERYRGGGPYAQTWQQHSDPDTLAGLLRGVWQLRGGARVLLAGSASGELVGALRARGFDAWGIDSHAAAIARTPPGLEPYNALGDVTSLGFADDSFDVIIESCLCHVAPRRLRKAIRELHRVTRRGLLFRSVTSDMKADLLDRGDLMRGVRSAATWWEWSERFFEAGFDLALSEQDTLQAVWEDVVAAGQGPDRWCDDVGALRYCLYTKWRQADLAVAQRSAAE